jgi:hypothetical protein
MTFSSDNIQRTNNRHQVYIRINDTSAEFDNDNNLVIKLQKLERGANHTGQREKQKQLSQQEKKFTLQQQNGR